MCPQCGRTGHCRLMVVLWTLCVPVVWAMNMLLRVKSGKSSEISWEVERTQSTEAIVQHPAMQDTRHSRHAGVASSHCIGYRTSVSIASAIHRLFRLVNLILLGLLVCLAGRLAIDDHTLPIAPARTSGRRQPRQCAVVGKCGPGRRDEPSKLDSLP